MCGILGLYSSLGLPPPGDAFKSALDKLRRRGPDDCGVWRDESVWLGHRRLAIIDRSAAGHQPMESADGRYCIVFNGEIYNHRDLRKALPGVHAWRGSSDTETLLEAYRVWGVKCLERLNGMFAFAIWDRTARRLFIARDRMGVKPLYYAQSEGRFGFASRPGALRMLFGDTTFEIDPEGLRVYLDLGYIPAPLSLHRQVRKLPAAHYALIDASGMQRVRYWDFRPIAYNEAFNERPSDELADELGSLIKDAVRVRLISDVPLGAFLSGGVDSAMVVASMKAAGIEHPKAFTIGFSEKAFDEGPAAARVAQHLGVDHVHETLSVDSLIDLLPLYAEEYDEPFADSSAFATLAVSRLARRHVTVALTGDGADELFGGYHYYGLMNRLTPLIRMRPVFKRRVVRALNCMGSHRAKLLGGALATDDPVALFAYLRSVSKDYPEVVNRDVIASTWSASQWFGAYASGFAMDLELADLGMRLDAGFTLPDLFLQKVDVASMAFSLEARCPMTDYRLVEWAMQLPLRYKVDNGSTKILLKKALCKFLPPQYVYRPKMGFGIPLAQWLRGPLRDWARDLVNDDALVEQALLEKAPLLQLLDQQSSGKRESHPLLWSVLMLLYHIRSHPAREAPSLDFRAVA